MSYTDFLQRLSAGREVFVVNKASGEAQLVIGGKSLTIPPGGNVELTAKYTAEDLRASETLRTALQSYLGLQTVPPVGSAAGRNIASTQRALAKAAQKRKLMAAQTMASKPKKTSRKPIKS